MSDQNKPKPELFTTEQVVEKVAEVLRPIIKAKNELPDDGMRVMMVMWNTNEEGTHLLGNSCVLCAINRMITVAIDNNLQHDAPTNTDMKQRMH